MMIIRLVLLVSLSVIVCGNSNASGRRLPESKGEEEILLTTSIHVISEPNHYHEQQQQIAHNCTTDDRNSRCERAGFDDDWQPQSDATDQRPEATNNSESVLTLPQQPLAGIQSLNGGFLVLFDEINRMKNNTINALIRLQYFDDNSLNLKTTTNGNRLSSPSERLQQQQPPSPPPPSQIRDNTTNKRVERPYDSRQKGGPNNPAGDTITIRADQPKRNNLRGQQRQQIGATRQQPAASSNLATKINWQLSGWLEQLSMKLNGLVRNMASGLFAPQRPQQQQQHSTRLSANPSGSPVATGRNRERTFDGRDHELTKRHTSSENSISSAPNGGSDSDDSGNQQQQSCVELNQNQLAECRSTELLVTYNLNNSFPGTLKSIEDNCRYISSLLGNCWPQQLQYLRQSLVSWNETVLAMTDFPLPTLRSSVAATSAPGVGDESASAASRQVWPTCGAPPQLISNLVMDRINWMWLNLCMDRKFRLDYVDNLKCLSLWTQERAQAVCSNEYKRMQQNLRSPPSSSLSPIVNSHPPSTGSTDRRTQQQQQMFADDTSGLAARRQPRGIDFVPSVSIPTISTAASQQQQQQQLQNRASINLDGLDEREFESKILCCIFDLFLRCVNRQAVRDCGRHGGQFVVNFMSRIGTDDFKYLCSSEPRAALAALPPDNPIHHAYTQQHQLHSGSQNQRSGSRRTNNPADRSPFIQGNYCTDTRIVAVLYGKSVEVYATDRGGPSHSATGLRQPTTNQQKGDHSGNRHSGFNNSMSQYDPSFFEDNPQLDSSASPVLVPPLELLSLVAIVVLRETMLACYLT